MYQGIVIFFSSKKGYGFLQRDQQDPNQKDLFVHYSNIMCDGFKTLQAGQKVEYDVGRNHKDEQAINVKVL